MSRIKNSVAFRLSVISFSLVLAACVISLAVSIGFYRNDIYKSYGDAAYNIAASVAGGIDPDRFAALIADEGAAGEEGGDGYYAVLKARMDTVKANTGAMYLYCLMMRPNGGGLVSIAEGVLPGEEPDAFFENTPDSEYAPETIETAMTGESTISKPYVAGEWGTMITATVPIFSQNGKILGIVGSDVNIDTINGQITRFAFIVGAIILVLAVFAAIFIAVYMNKNVGAPVKKLSSIAEAVSYGDNSADIYSENPGIFKELYLAFANMCSVNKKQAAMLTRIADGDYSFKVNPRSDKDEVIIALKKILSNNVRVFSKISGTSQTVMSDTSRISDATQILQKGTREQSEFMEKLRTILATILQKAVSNADKSENAETLSEQVNAAVIKSERQMTQMSAAIGEVASASDDIKKIIEVIDDIAFQTNILAINASVEASRAGIAGKGFSVVAQEVRQLAQKSSAAAANSAKLITRSVEHAELSNGLAGEALKSFGEISKGILSVIESVSAVNEASREQQAEIDKINSEVEAVLDVVRHNTAIAEESAAQLTEIDSTTRQLNDMIKRFIIE